MSKLTMIGRLTELAAAGADIDELLRRRLHGAELVTEMEGIVDYVREVIDYPFDYDKKEGLEMIIDILADVTSVLSDVLCAYSIAKQVPEE